MSSLNDLQYDTQYSSWIQTDSQTNALATASRAAEADQHHVLMNCEASFSAAPAAPVLLQIKFGTTVVLERYVPTTGGASVFFGSIGVMNRTANQAVSAELGAGGVANIGKVALIGFTTGKRL